MHGYESDNFFRSAKIYLILAILAISAGSAVQSLFTLPFLLSYVNRGALSTGMIYGFLIFLYENWGWRWLSTLKNLNGTWVGNINSSYNGKTTIPCVMHVRQTWKRMMIELHTEQSHSRTTMAALFDNQSGDVSLQYKYVSEPRGLATPTMQMHRGSCALSIVKGSSDSRLRGNYYTGRGRETHGEISLSRISQGVLDFETALKKQKDATNS